MEIIDTSSRPQQQNRTEHQNKKANLLGKSAKDSKEVGGGS
jgi:hypothetical protein